MKILSIGDIHGEETWKLLTHGSYLDYDMWRSAVSHGAPPDTDFWRELPFMSYDRIIFVGDYVDSFTVSNAIIKRNLEDIVHLRRSLGDRVILLLGNHDVQYIIPNVVCSGFRAEMKHDLYDIFTKNSDIFTIAHEETTEDGEKWLWSHAGVTSGWFKELNKSMMNPRFRFSEVVKDFDPSKKKISELLNFAWEMRMACLHNVDVYSGGFNSWAGPLWVRPTIMNYWPLESYNQVMGHTPQSAVWVVESDPDGEDYPGFKHHFIDCLHTAHEGLAIEI